MSPQGHSHPRAACAPLVPRPQSRVPCPQKVWESLSGHRPLPGAGKWLTETSRC